MELMPAHNAYCETKRILQENREQFVGIIANKIHNAIMNGKYSITIPDSDVCDGSLSILRSQGYDYSYDYKEGTYVIRWEKE
jgi:ribosomal protein S8